MVSKARLEAFSDGVFAIAITLLVLSLAQPAADSADVGRDLLNEWPGYAAYAVSFLVIGIMWINHHALFTHIEAPDRMLGFLNLMLLMGVCLLPFPTGLVGRALQDGHGQVPAAAMYSAVTWFIALGFNALWLRAAVGRRLLVPDFAASEVPRSIIRFGVGGVVYGVIFAVSFVNPLIALGGHALMALYYVVDQLAGGVPGAGGAAKPAEA